MVDVGTAAAGGASLALEESHVKFEMVTKAEQDFPDWKNEGRKLVPLNVVLLQEEDDSVFYRGIDEASEVKRYAVVVSTHRKIGSGPAGTIHSTTSVQVWTEHC